MKKLKWYFLATFALYILLRVIFSPRTLAYETIRGVKNAGVVSSTTQTQKHRQFTESGRKLPTIIDSSWSKETISSIIDHSKYPNTLHKLVKCESDYTSIKRIDSNGYYSYGILQFQSSTWNHWSVVSGYVGDPMNPYDAISMAEWAIDHGMIRAWSCARIQALL